MTSKIFIENNKSIKDLFKYYKTKNISDINYNNYIFKILKQYNFYIKSIQDSIDNKTLRVKLLQLMKIEFHRIIRNSKKLDIAEKCFSNKYIVSRYKTLTNKKRNK